MDLVFDITESIIIVLLYQCTNASLSMYQESYIICHCHLLDLRGLASLVMGDAVARYNVFVIAR